MRSGDEMNVLSAVQLLAAPQAHEQPEKEQRVSWSYDKQVGGDW